MSRLLSAGFLGAWAVVLLGGCGEQACPLIYIPAISLTIANGASGSGDECRFEAFVTDADGTTTSLNCFASAEDCTCDGGADGEQHVRVEEAGEVVAEFDVDVQIDEDDGCGFYETEELSFEASPVDGAGGSGGDGAGGEGQGGGGGEG